MITIKFNNVTTEIQQNADGLYRLNDLHKAYHANDNSSQRTKKSPENNSQQDSSKPSKVARSLSDFKFGIYCIKKVNGGKYPGVYANERGVYWYAAKLDEVFESVVYETFELLTNGNTEQAMDKALSVAIPQALIDKERELRKTLGDEIKKAISDGRANKMCYMTINKNLSKKMSGWTPKCLTGGGLSAFDYAVSVGSTEGVSGYLASMELVITAFRCGMDYHQAMAMIKVETSKNKLVLVG